MQCYRGYTAMLKIEATSATVEVSAGAMAKADIQISCLTILLLTGATLMSRTPDDRMAE
jgi:hypothetical protein